jgi:mono/diheme cytochrome c family protein
MRDGSEMRIALPKILFEASLPASFVILLGIAAAPGASATAAEVGKALFTNYGCYRCHNYEGQGAGISSYTGPRIAPTSYSLEQFESIVRKPYGIMPAFSTNVLSDADLKTIYGYISSIPEPPPLTKIPLLSKRLQSEKSGDKR